MFKNLATISTLLLILVLQGCEDKTRRGEGAGKFGMMSQDTPEYTAKTFFEHIYNDRTLDGALALSTPKVANLLKSYHTNKNVQRHVLNLSYDANKVEVQPDSGNSIGRPEYSTDATVTVFFTGYFHDDQIEDIRVVEMVREGSQWKVSEIKPDKYL